MSKFEYDLSADMNKYLQATKSQADLVKAAEYLNSAIDIFEDAQMFSYADNVLKILSKIAAQDINNHDKPEFTEKVLKWMENPEDKEEIKFESILEPEEEIKFRSLLHKDEPEESDEDFTFESIASELGLDMNNIKDRHTKGLTSEKMIKNLKHHGTQFNMADDGLDLLNLDLNDQESTLDSDEDFEDE